MPTREAMHSLADEITSSYEARVAALGSLRSEVVTQTRTTQAAHHAMTQRLRSGLAQERSDLASEGKQLRASLARGHSDRTGGVAAQLSQIDAAHHAMTQQLRADLAQGHSDRTSTAQQLRAELARGRSNRASGVAAQLSQIDAAHHAMTQELRADLAKGHSDRTSTAQQLRTELAKGRSDRTSEVRVWMHEVAATHAGARDAWQNLTALMQRKRAAPSRVVKAPGPSYQAGGPPAAPALTIEIPVEETAGNGEEDGSLAILADRAFDYLAGHPDGARLADLEQELALGRFQMNRVVRRLTDRGKVEKRDLLYFAI